MGNVASRAGTVMSIGKWYWEITLIGVVTGTWIGVGKSTAGLDIYVGGDFDGWGYNVETGQKATNGVPSVFGDVCIVNDIIGVAYDADAGEIWWSKNGVWQASGDPEAATSPAYTGITGSISPMVSMTYSPAKIEANFGQSAFSYSVPSGFETGVYESSENYMGDQGPGTIVDSMNSNQGYGNVFTTDWLGGTIKKFWIDLDTGINTSNLKLAIYETNKNDQAASQTIVEQVAVVVNGDGIIGIPASLTKKLAPNKKYMICVVSDNTGNKIQRRSRTGFTAQYISQTFSSAWPITSGNWNTNAISYAYSIWVDYVHPTRIYGLWNTDDKASTVRLENYDTIMINQDAGSKAGVRGNTSLKVGKFYFEFKLIVGVSTTSYTGYGVCRSAWSNSGPTGPGEDDDGWAVNRDGQFRHNNVLGSGDLSGILNVNDIINVAVDLDNNKIWFGRNGTWSGDPVADTGEAFSDVTGIVYPACMVSSSTYGAQIISDPNDYNYSAPAGFNPVIYF